MFVQGKAISEYYHNETINLTYLTVILHPKVVFGTHAFLWLQWELPGLIISKTFNIIIVFNSAH